jgi:hypothetical protein
MNGHRKPYALYPQKNTMQDRENAALCARFPMPTAGSWSDVFVASIEHRVTRYRREPPESRATSGII